MKTCGSCGGHARHSASRARDLRGRDCPRWETVHRGCCAAAVCSALDARGHVRCGWESGGRERVERSAAAAAAKPLLL